MRFEDCQYVNLDYFLDHMHMHYLERVKSKECHVSISNPTIVVNHLEDEQVKHQQYGFHEQQWHFVILELKGRKLLRMKLLYRPV